MLKKETAHRDPSAVRHSFVVRIWREEGQSTWLGRVQHAGSGVEVCIRNLGELLDFIERWVDGLPTTSEAALRQPEPPAARLK